MKKNLFNNHPYKTSDLKTWGRIKEVTHAFWRSRINWPFKKNIQNYFLNEDIKNWIIYSKPLENSYAPVITWIGHSTFLIQVGGANILTDPAFFDLNFLYPRNCVPGITLQNLPQIDFVIISHNHNDHMEKQSLFALKKHHPIFLVPKGIKSWFDKNRFYNVYENEWWQGHSFSIRHSKTNKINFSFLPAIHWSGTHPFNINKTFWGSFMIEFENFKIYFAGDTTYATHFQEIAQKFNNINLALMPISPNGPKEIMESSHVNAEQAVQAFLDLKAKNFVPMHWGTYRLATDKFFEPIEKLQKAWQEKQNILFNKNLYILKFGQQLKI